MRRVKRFITALLVLTFSAVNAYSLPKFTNLDGEWEFFLEKSPEQIFSAEGSELKGVKQNVPGFWNKEIENQKGVNQPHTYGCYRHTVTGLDPKQEYAFLLNDTPQSACAIFVNRKQIASSGNPFKILTGEKIFPSDSQIKPLHGEFYSDKDGNAEIVIFIANFFYRKSGLWSSLLIGTSQDIFNVNTIILTFYTIVFGVLFFIGMLNLIQFFINKKSKEYLYLGIVAIVFALRIGTAGYCSLGTLFSWFNASIKIKCEFLCLWLAPIYLLRTLYSLYPSEIKNAKFLQFTKFFRYIYCIIGYTLGVLTLLTPARICNEFVPVLQMYQVSASVYVMGLCIYNIIKKKKHILYFFTGILFLSLGAVLDLIYTRTRTSFPISVFPFFLVVFIFCLLHLLASIQNDIYRDTVKVSENLTKLNEAYLKFVPKEFLTLLNKDDITKIKLGDYSNIEMPIMFSKTVIKGNLNAEETFTVFNEYLESISPVIKRHGGFVSKFLSGGFIAIFTNYSIEAVYAAEEIIFCTNRINEKYADKNLSVSTKIGLHYGKMIIGTIGEENRMDDTVISDTVNTASRIESVCEKLSKTIILSQELKDKIETESPYNGLKLIPLKAIQVKGKQKPLQLFEYVEKEDI